jgi:hypothetical protein
MLAQETLFDGGVTPMARLENGVRVPEGIEAEYSRGSHTAENLAFVLGISLQSLLTHILLLLSFGLFSRREWGPALIVFAVYVITLAVNASGRPFYENDGQ